jgi:hypothetical protein
MKYKSIFLSIFMLYSVFSFQSCDSDDTSEVARVRIKLVDAPGDFKAVNIDLIDILVNSAEDEEGWKSLENVNADIYDLIELTAGNEALLADVKLPSGYLNQIRLVLGDENTVVFEDDDEDDENDRVEDLNTPSAQQSGLKLNLHTELIAGVTYEFILDWDAAESVVEAGNSGKFNLKPVIRVAAEATSGAINGRVADVAETEENAEPMPLDGATVSVYDNNNSLYATTFSNEEGLFVVKGVEEGDYTIIVTATDYDDSSEIGPISVTIGASAEAGVILLTKTI